MLVLGISSALHVLEAALIEDDHLLCAHSLGEGLKAEDITGLIDRALLQAKKDIKDISLVAVTLGPGSYGGLRGGMAAAKAISQSLMIPLAAVPTIDASSGNLSDLPGLVVIALDAIKDEYNAAIFSQGIRLTEDFTASGEKLAVVLSKISGAFYLASPRDDIFLRIKELYPSSRVRQVEKERSLPSARAVAKIGLENFRRGDLKDPLTLTPLYSHEPNIREYKRPRS